MKYEDFIDAAADNSLPLSYSALKRLDKTPLHFNQFQTIDGGIDVETLDLTRILHAILFPTRHSKKPCVVIPTGVDNRSNAGKAIMADLKKQAAATKAVLMAQKDYDEAERLAECLKQYTTEYNLIESCTQFDVFDKVPYPFEGETFCLSRHLVAYNPSRHILQISVVSDANPSKMTWQRRDEMWNLGAFINSYLTETPFYRICIDKKGHAACFGFSDAALADGEHQLKRLLTKYNEYRRNPRLWNASWGYVHGDENGIIY